MAYDALLAERIRALMQPQAGLTEKKMFGGLAFLVNGNMAVAASGKGGLLVRINPEQSGELLASTKAQRMIMRGRGMPGWLRVAANDLTHDNDLAQWVKLGTAYAQTLPAK